ncbi:hypothetical protein [Marisediminicola sp. LYQ134]|uniref:hypothetical protein n=1 Tax=unclassified Marisediminicola TaxID=2618316 RepID=UPI00398334EC
MTHHDGTNTDHDGGLDDEAADFVHPVDHGKGADETSATTEGKGDYVSPVDHGDDEAGS